MSDQQLRTEEQARRLATFLEAAMADQGGFWLPRAEMVARVRQIVLERPLTGLRFLRGAAMAAGMRWETVEPVVWARVADLLEAGPPSDTQAHDGGTQAQVPAWDNGLACWTTADDALLEEWLDEQSGGTT